MLPILLLGCGGPSDVTIIHDVEIVHVGAQPPELQPGESTTLTATVADPLGEGVEVLAWACTDLGEGCVEDTGQPTSAWVHLLQPTDEDVTLEIQASTLWGELSATDTAAPPLEPYVGVWVLACRPGLCPQVQLAAALPEPGSDEDAALRAFLSDPTPALADLPLDGVSLAWRQVPVRQRAEGEAHNENPELRLADDGSLAQPVGGEAELVIELIDETPDALQLDGSTTIGTLGPARTDIYSPMFTWYAGDNAGSGRIYVVARDGEGGSALLRVGATVTGS